ncbi:hypothetical protein BB559_000980 [Furculomyces boomerangus]|uniref:Ankyrin repeat protein n=2 Tax=Harpellales TaxID=61421 RepID=A0A2T9Z3G2_9FUNG|nr:hypothetical protein BB559_000980 [Furculomyces boomerangus]PVZ96650.1 hypothetical protein BB558_007429 [Smittium angustum]
METPNPEMLFNTLEKNTEILKIFIQYGLLLYPTGDSIFSGFFKKRNLKVVESENNRVNTVQDSQTSLISSIQNDHLGVSGCLLWVVEFLEQIGANIHAENKNALLCACGNGHLNIVEYLVEN